MIRWLTIYLFALASALNPALAALTVNQLSGFNAIQTEAAPPPSASVTFNGCSGDGSDLSVYTFASVSIGAASSDRIVLLGTGAEDSTDVIVHPTATIGGITATRSATTNGSYSVHSGFLIAAVPTGTTATIEVTYSETMTSLGICTWSLYGFSSAAFAATSRNTTDTGSSFDNTISVTEGDLLAAMSTTKAFDDTIASDADLSTAGWTTVTIGGTAGRLAYGYTFPVTATGSVTITTNWSGANDVHTNVVVITP